MRNISLFCLWLLLLLTSALAPAQSRPSRNIENGKRLFVLDGCYECHGYVGQGGAAGPRIAPWTIGAEVLIAYLRHPAGQMPPYTEKVISNEDLKDISAYLESIPAPAADKNSSASKPPQTK